MDAFDFDILMPSGAKALLLRSERETKLDPPPAHVLSGAPSFFKTLEELEADYVPQTGVPATSSADPSPTPDVGSNDPRPDIVSTKVISSTDAELLLDQCVYAPILLVMQISLRFNSHTHISLVSILILRCIFLDFHFDLDSGLT